MGGDVIVGFGPVTRVEGVDVGGSMGLSGGREDFVVGAGWVVVVEEGNVGDCVRGVVVGPIGKGSAVRTCRRRGKRWRSCERHQRSRKLIARG